MNQSPDGDTQHVVLAGETENPTTVIGVITKYTVHNEEIRLVWKPKISARYIRILSTKSPSWIAWQFVKIE